MSQTNIQKNEALRYGSVILYVGDDFSSLINVGAIRNMSFEHKAENIEVAFDNVPSIKKFKSGKKGSFVFDLAEIDLTTFSKTDAGLVVQSSVAGTPVAGAIQNVLSGSWNYNKFIKIENQNGDGSAITVNSVTAATDGALVEGTDYYIGQNNLGEYGIFIIDSVTVTTEAQDIAIDYDYTPNASKKLTFNTGGTKTAKVARIVNTDNNGKTFRIDLENVSNIKPLTTPFQADDSDDIMVVSMELEGEIVEIVDEQSVA